MLHPAATQQPHHAPFPALDERWSIPQCRGGAAGEDMHAAVTAFQLGRSRCDANHAISVFLLPLSAPLSHKEMLRMRETVSPIEFAEQKHACHDSGLLLPLKYREVAPCNSSEGAHSRCAVNTSARSEDGSNELACIGRKTPSSYKPAS